MIASGIMLDEDRDVMNTTKYKPIILIVKAVIGIFASVRSCVRCLESGFISAQQIAEFNPFTVIAV